MGLMPRVELRDAVGQAYRIDSLSLDRIKDWLSEWVPKLHDPAIGLTMSVWPLPTVYRKGRWEMDWPADSRWITMTWNVPGDPEGAYQAMIDRRAWIERKIRESTP